ncbi:MAG: hypothetical protein JST75_02195 [Bacteroidetes bacterium]|nr:hypothetical protein [Bacteroidota bacterium]
MDTYKLQDDVKTFGFRVKNFPNGIGEAFESLLKLFPKDESRSYYGVGEFGNDGSILYYALAEEKFDGEGKKYGYPVKLVEKGEYLVVVVKNWTNKTDCIKDVFAEIMIDKRVAAGKPCVEWYKTMDEMWCMVPCDSSKS